jgi:hypothetical protein
MPKNKSKISRQIPVTRRYAGFPMAYLPYWIRIGTSTSDEGNK